MMCSCVTTWCSCVICGVYCDDMVKQGLLVEGLSLCGLCCDRKAHVAAPGSCFD